MKTVKIHHPKHISSDQGLGIPQNKRNIIKQDHTLILTEIWALPNKPWNQDGVIIADKGYKWVSEWVEGRNYLYTKFYNTEGILVGEYYDVCSPIKSNGDFFELEDWYLDVWKPANGAKVILDKDEFEDALKVGYLTMDQGKTAKSTALHLLDNS